METTGQKLIRCKKCNEYKDIDSYYTSKLTSTGLRGSCKVCTRNQDKEYRENNIEKVKYSTKSKRCRREYGITVEEYEEKMRTSSVCEICGKTEGRNANDMFCYDHDHSTGEFRGVLCRACNQAIGLLGDTVEGLTKALNYLKRRNYGVLSKTFR